MKSGVGMAGEGGRGHSKSIVAWDLSVGGKADAQSEPPQAQPSEIAVSAFPTVLDLNLQHLQKRSLSPVLTPTSTVRTLTTHPRMTRTRQHRFGAKIGPCGPSDIPSRQAICVRALGYNSPEQTSRGPFEVGSLHSS